MILSGNCFVQLSMRGFQKKLFHAVTASAIANWLFAVQCMNVLEYNFDGFYVKYDQILIVTIFFIAMFHYGKQL